MRRQGQELEVLTWIQTYSRIPSILGTQRDKFGSD